MAWQICSTSPIHFTLGATFRQYKGAPSIVVILAFLVIFSAFQSFRPSGFSGFPVVSALKPFRL
jgi:hypothetical protein